MTRFRALFPLCLSLCLLTLSSPKRIPLPHRIATSPIPGPGLRFPVQILPAYTDKLSKHRSTDPFPPSSPSKRKNSFYISNRNYFNIKMTICFKNLSTARKKKEKKKSFSFRSETFCIQIYVYSWFTFGLTRISVSYIFLELYERRV